MMSDGVRRRRILSLHACKTRHCRTIHPPVFAQSSALTSRLHHPVLNAACLMVVRSSGTHVLLAQNKSDRITFSKFNFLPLKNLRKQKFFRFYVISVE